MKKVKKTKKTERVQLYKLQFRLSTREEWLDSETYPGKYDLQAAESLVNRLNKGLIPTVAGPYRYVPVKGK